MFRLRNVSKYRYSLINVQFFRSVGLSMTKELKTSSHIGQVLRCPCSSCETESNHTIVAGVELQLSEEDSYNFYGSDMQYQTIKCNGCDNISFRTAHYSTEDIYYIEGEENQFNDIFLNAEEFYPNDDNSKNISPTSKALSELIKGLDIPSIDTEFERALSNVNTEPREAVSAACNILESIFKVYIEDEELEKPQKQDLQNVWKVVRNDLGFNTNTLEDNDLRKIMSGILSVVDGIGAFRTHASSAHGPGRKVYNLKPRHARLAIHSAHTIALFVLETWNERKSEKAR